MQNELIENFKYRPEIDGLRGVAVLAVLFYHCGISFSGGYVGVDVFFVISGYLITSIIVRDVGKKNFKIIDFWEKRARRILPASMFMFIIVMIIGWWLLLPSDYMKFGKSLLSQTVFSGNIYFWRTIKYFAGPAEQQPLLHTWSLAVEEQFYMILPFMLMGLLSMSAFRRRKVLIITLSVFIIGSFCLCIVMQKRFPSATFYLLPTRAWELLCGSLISLVPAKWFLGRTKTKEIFCIIGIIGIILPFFLYSKNTLFPGAAALPVVVGSSLLILGCSSERGEKLSIVGRCLSFKPIVFIGLISYSLYLWHWPLVTFSHYWALEEFSPSHRVAIILASFILAYISWKFVETPFRVRKLGKTQKSMFAYSFIGIGMILLGGVSINSLEGFPQRFSEQVNRIDNTKANELIENRICKSLTLDLAKKNQIPRLGAPPPAPVEVLVWGDSHARSILPAVITAAEKQNFGVYAAWHSSTAPVEDYKVYGKASLGEDASQWSEEIIKFVKKEQIHSVLLVAYWSSYFRSDRTSLHRSSESSNIDECLLETVGRLTEMGSQVWVLKEVPIHHAPVPLTLIKAELFGIDYESYASNRDSYKEQTLHFDNLSIQLETAGAKIIDVSDQLYNKRLGIYNMQVDGEALYYDNHHLTQVGANRLWPSFLQIFEKNE